MNREKSQLVIEMSFVGTDHLFSVLLFHQLDPENTGFIAVENFTSLVEHHELQLDPSKLDMLLALVQSNEEGQVCYQELIELVSASATKEEQQTNKCARLNEAEGL